MKILLLEDDILLNEIISEHLESKPYEVISVFNGEEALSILLKESFDLLLLDVNVPGLNGFDVLKEIRKVDINTPTIYITSLDMIEDMEKGFKIGCNDYMKKPFELRELDLRIENIKKVFNISSEDTVQIRDNIFLDRTNLLIKNQTKSIHITQKECDVLEYLIRNKNKPISIEELSINVWSYEESPIASTIRTYIKNLRKVLGDELISNIRGVGYRLNC